MMKEIAVDLERDNQSQMVLWRMSFFFPSISVSAALLAREIEKVKGN